MRHVSKEEFYAKIGPLNVHAHIEPTPFPYTAIWKMQPAPYQVIGKSVDRRDGGRIITDYYLS